MMILCDCIDYKTAGFIRLAIASSLCLVGKVTVLTLRS